MGAGCILGSVLLQGEDTLALENSLLDVGQLSVPGGRGAADPELSKGSRRGRNPWEQLQNINIR